MFEARVLEPETLRLLHRLGELPELEPFFLVGGTALAIQIGHRKSEDLDFFTRDSFETEAVLEAIRRDDTGDLIVLGKATNTLNLAIGGVKVDVMRHGYPLVDDLVSVGKVRMAQPADIAAMKLAAITNRGSRKDFVDLYFLLREFSLSDMLAFYEQKYAGHDLFPVIKSLAWFDDAEGEPDPILLEEVSWEMVKEGVREALREIG